MKENFTVDQNYIFLLGGHDLEMEEIKKILEDKGLNFYDKNLKWGAKLSEYKEKFDDVHNFVGVELISDCILPRCKTDIDHHNERSHLPASIEQVASILAIELSTYQKLVAANDKGYIPAMEAAGASLDEINEIRQNDRNAQGVDNSDEELAVEAINNGLQRYGDLIIVKSLTTRFSAITDRLYPFIKLLVLTDDQLVYYGKDSFKLKDQYADLIKIHKAFSGGGPDGFLGLVKGQFTENEILNIKKEIILKMSDQ